MSKISLIIPAYNENTPLPRMLDTVAVARERFAGGRDAVAVIVADNASMDDYSRHRVRPRLQGGAISRAIEWAGCGSPATA